MRPAPPDSAESTVPAAAAPDAPATEAPPKPRWRAWLRGGIQVALTLALLFLATRNLKWADLRVVLADLRWGWVLLAALALNTGMLVSGLRQQRMQRAAGIRLPYRLSLWLFYRGMFYNMALPGGISGDGYKAYYLNRRASRQQPKAKGWGRLGRIVTALVLERASGALALAWWVAVLVLLLDPADLAAAYQPYLRWVRLLAWGGLVAVPLAALVPLRPGAQFARTFRGTLPYSLGVQAMQMACAGALFLATGQAGAALHYVLTFLGSSLAAVLPISLGGIGVREFVLSQAHRVLPVHPEAGVAVALTYHALYLTSAALSMLVRSPEE